MIVRDDQLPLGAGTTQDEVPALPAASVLVLRGQPYEVLLLRRHEGSRFVPGAWVFPGGVLEPADEALARRLTDGGVLGAMRVCAARELFEESGIWLGRPLQDAEAKRHALLESETSFANLVEESAVELDRLTWTARWITPIGIPRRLRHLVFSGRSGSINRGDSRGAGGDGSDLDHPGRSAGASSPR